jgi:hypothetical protein
VGERRIFKQSLRPATNPGRSAAVQALAQPQDFIAASQMPSLVDKWMSKSTAVIPNKNQR